jgi:ABC-type uncharacterized transport system permease subunit
VGLNPQAAEYGGINVAREHGYWPWPSAGAIAGLAGTEQILGLHNRFIVRFLRRPGLYGRIAVALLGQEPSRWSDLFAAILFGALQTGSAAMDRSDVGAPGADHHYPGPDHFLRGRRVL